MPCIHHGYLSVSQWATLCCKNTRVHPMRVVINHISDPRRRTYQTTSFKKVPDIRASAPSLTSILDIHDQFTRYFRRLPTTIGQSYSKAINMRPRKLNSITMVRRRPYTLKAIYVIFMTSSTTILSRLCSYPLVNWAVLG